MDGQREEFLLANELAQTSRPEKVLVVRRRGHPFGLTRTRPQGTIVDGKCDCDDVPKGVTKSED